MTDQLGRGRAIDWPGDDLVADAADLAADVGDAVVDHHAHVGAPRRWRRRQRHAQLRQPVRDSQSS